MEDKLKEFIQKNKAQFEQDMPSQDLWSKIDQDLGTEKTEKKRLINFSNWKIAASILLVLGSALTIYNYSTSDTSTWLSRTELADNDDAEHRTDTGLINDLSVISEDLAEVDNFYTIQVSNKMNELKKYEVDDDLMDEVASLKEEFETLKKEMGVGADQALIVEAMINNYRLRLALLEDLLEAVDNKKEKKIKYEKNV